MVLHRKFESLLISRDAHIVRGMTRIMDDLLIQTDVCMMSSEVLERLKRRDIDLLVIDWDATGAEEMLRTIRKAVGRRMTIAAVMAPSLIEDIAIQAGVDGIIHKPLTSISRVEFHCHVYHRMVGERRQERRYVIKWLVAVTDLAGNFVPITMTDISEVGIGLCFVGQLSPDDVLKFRVELPGTNHIIHFNARVVWKLDNQTAGAEFIQISPGDSAVLRDWLRERNPVPHSAEQPQVQA